VAQGIGVVLVLVAAGNLQEALAQHEREGMPYWSAPPVAHVCGEGGGQAQAVVGLGAPDQTTI
jgi:hypothetical protein